jgi:hypothetical protein
MVEDFGALREEVGDACFSGDSGFTLRDVMSRASEHDARHDASGHDGHGGGHHSHGDGGGGHH